MKNIFITATNTNIGKTYTTLKLIANLSEKGYKVGVCKPIETGVITQPEDATLLLECCQKYNQDFKNLSTKDICPIQFQLPAAPIIAAKFQKINLDLVFETITKLHTLCDILLIEGAGGLMVPIQKEYFMIDFLSDLNATPLLVTHDRLGCINDTLLNLELLKSKDLTPTICVNVQELTSFEEITLPYYQIYFPEFFILQTQLDQITQALITDSHSDRNT